MGWSSPGICGWIPLSRSRAKLQQRLRRRRSLPPRYSFLTHHCQADGRTHDREQNVHPNGTLPNQKRPNLFIRVIEIHRKPRNLNFTRVGWDHCPVRLARDNGPKLQDGNQDPLKSSKLIFASESRNSDFFRYGDLRSPPPTLIVVKVRHGGLSLHG